MSDPAQEGKAEFRLVPPAEDASTLALYSNFAQATATPHDLTLHFGWYAIPALTEEPKEPVPVHVRALAKVTIPIGLVRGTINILEQQLRAWEETFGAAAEQHANEEQEPAR